MCGNIRMDKIRSKLWSYHKTAGLWWIRWYLNCDPPYHNTVGLWGIFKKI